METGSKPDFLFNLVNILRVAPNQLPGVTEMRNKVVARRWRDSLHLLPECRSECVEDRCLERISPDGRVKQVAAL